jgi:hydrophobe/amphiphile efflux-3 (HAE3) family protein
MHALMIWIHLHPKSSTSIALLATLLCAFQIQHIKIDGSANGLVVADSPEALFYEETKAVFGDDNNLTIVYKAQDIFTRDILQSIEDLSYEAQEIEGITRVVSLTSVNNLRADDDGFLNTDTLLPYVPDSLEEIAKIRENSLANELIQGEVINSTGTVAAIQLSVQDRPNDPTFNSRLAQDVETLLDRERAKLTQVEMYQIGNITIANSMMQYIYNDLLTVTPLSLTVLVLILFFFFRSGVTVLLPIVTGILSILVSLGFMAMLDFALNPISLIVPALLLIIGSTEDIHILAEYELGLRDLQEKQAAIRQMATRSGLVIFLTSLTTFAGFMTLGPNSIPIISEFGIIAALGIIANFLLTILIAPPLLASLPVPLSFTKPEKEFLSGITQILVNLVIRRRRTILVASGLFLLANSVAIYFIKIDSNYLSFFRDDAPVRELIDDVGKHLSGANAFYVIVDTQKIDGLKDSEDLKAIAELSDYLATRYTTVVSYDRFVRKTHQEMNGGSEQFFVVPDDDNLISQYTLLMQPETLERFADFEFQKACLVVRSSLVGSEKMNKDIAEIRAYIDDHFPVRMKVTITGGSVLIAKASDQISREMIVNIALMLAMIFLVISALFMSFRAGLLSVLPNSLPVIGSLGAMSLLDIPLSTGTFPVVIISLGIAVDDTLHFMVRFSNERKKSTDNKHVVNEALKHELKPILGTSLALIFGFSMLMFAEFRSIAEFGLLSAITICLALISDLVITPALLMTIPLITYWDLLKLSIDEELMDSNPLFVGLTHGEIKRFVLMGSLRNFEVGEVLMRENDTDRNMMLVLEGKLDVLVANQEGVDQKINDIQAGDIVGEMALLVGVPRTATVKVTQDAEVLMINPEILQRVDSRYPKMAVKIHQNISQIIVPRLLSRLEPASSLKSL